MLFPPLITLELWHPSFDYEAGQPENKPMNQGGRVEREKKSWAFDNIIKLLYLTRPGTFL